MNTPKFLECLALCSCSLTYVLFYLGVHTDAMYLVLSIAYIALMLANWMR